MVAETETKGYCVDITQATINTDVCSTNYLKVIPLSTSRSTVCGGNSGSNDKCAICTTID